MEIFLKKCISVHIVSRNHGRSGEGSSMSPLVDNTRSLLENHEISGLGEHFELN